jgi:hypothetical protein
LAADRHGKVVSTFPDLLKTTTSRLKGMDFIKALRSRIKSGEITTSIRIWRSPRVKVGGRYRLEDGFVIVEEIRQIGLNDITPGLARASGFAGIVDLLKTARHSSGQKVYWIRFRYEQA